MELEMWSIIPSKDVADQTDQLKDLPKDSLSTESVMVPNEKNCDHT